MAFGLTRRGNDSVFDQLFALRKDFDDFFHGRDWPLLRSDNPWNPAVEVLTDNGRFIVKAHLPGVEPANVKVDVLGDVLTIRGERKQSTRGKDANYLQREFSYGLFERSLPLPEGVNGDALEASFSNGELIINAPLGPKAQARTIEVKAPAPAEKKAVA